MGYAATGLNVFISHFPWETDPDFQQVFRAVRGHTLVDPYRLYELWTLVQQTSKLSSGDLIEVGVWRGGSGALIAAQAKRHCPQQKVFLCDTFAGVPKAGPRDLYVGGEHADTSATTAQALLNNLSLPNASTLSGIFPDDTGHLVEERTFRFAHLDVDVYDSAKDCHNWIWPRLVPGGVVVYDDYGHIPCGLTEFVDEQQNEPDRLVLYNLNGHGIVIKLF